MRTSRPGPNSSQETLPFFADDTIAFVQTPQAYGNLHTVIARGAAYMQTVFYRFIQPGPQSLQRGVLRRDERRVPAEGDR